MFFRAIEMAHFENEAKYRTRSRRSPWRVWWPAAVGFGIFVASAIFGAAMSPNDNMDTTDWQVLQLLCGGVPAGLGGLIWSVVLARRATNRQITEFMAETFLRESELLAVSPCAHCPGHRPGGLRGWLPRGIGGILALTDQELVFRTNSLEFRDYELRIELQDIQSAQRCRIAPSPCGLRVRAKDSSETYFMFPVFIGTARVQRLAELIEFARGRLTP